MAYTYTTFKPLPRVQWCPLCDGKRVDHEAVKQHNERVAQDGERSYRWR